MGAPVDHIAGRPRGSGTIGKRGTFWILLVSSVGFLTLFLVLPLLMMAALSLRLELRGPMLEPFAPTIEHYQALAASPS